MGFTIEDMMLVSKAKYKMKLIAGANGWSNSISWILLIEDSKVLKNFKGRDLAVTTGFGFSSGEDLLGLVQNLVAKNAAGLIVNTGPYIADVPETVVGFCNKNDFPLLTIPWSTQIYDMIKDLSLRVLLQSATDEQISSALIQAIEHPDSPGMSEKDLLPYFDVDGEFQVALISNGVLDIMDTVERRRISYQFQIYLENITHNAHFFYYDSNFILVMNALTREQIRTILDGFVKRTGVKLPKENVSVGVGSMVTDISNLHISYKRARAAVEKALREKQKILYFDEMGIGRVFALMPDKLLLAEMGKGELEPLIVHDREHDSGYVQTLYLYLESGGSIQKVADQMFTHRNTILYRMNNIRQLLGCSLETTQDRMRYMIACMIYLDRWEKPGTEA